MADVELPNPDDVAEQKENTFTKRVALTVAAYAVVLAISSLGGSNAAKEMMLSQMEASNQWARYQAKVIRENQALLAWKRLELDLKERGTAMTTEARSAFEALIADWKKEEKRQDDDQKEIEAEARKHMEIRDRNQRKDPYFDYAEVLLQIAIVLASVSMLAESRPVFLFSVVLALGGALLAVNGDGLFVEVPFISG